MTAGYRNLCRLSTAAMSEPVSGHVVCSREFPEMLFMVRAARTVQAGRFPFPFRRAGAGGDHQDCCGMRGTGSSFERLSPRAHPGAFGRGPIREAKQEAARVPGRFGRRVFIELQDHGLVGQSG